MDDANLPALPQEFLEIVHPVDTTTLETYEDHVAATVEQINRKDSSSWGLADIFVSLVEKFGEPSQISLASQLNIPRSTMTNYLRTARAFPPAKRLPDISFTHHMEASFADSYDERQKAFTSETRFEWVELAAEQKLRTAHLQNKIKQSKEKERLQVTFLPCYFCDRGDSEVLEFVILSRDPNSSKRSSDQYLFHKECYYKVKSLIDGARTKHE